MSRGTVSALMCSYYSLAWVVHTLSSWSRIKHLGRFTSFTVMNSPAEDIS